MSTTMSTCWGFVINNPDDNDRQIVRNPPEQHVKQIVFTPEVGGTGTPHIQGWLKLHRQQRLSFVKRLLPRANFVPLTNDLYNLNARAYSLKEDETTAGNHMITTTEIMPDPINFLTRVLDDWLEHHWECLTDHTLRRHAQIDAMEEKLYSQSNCFRFLDNRERELIEEKPYICKLVLSPLYNKAKKFYWKQILSNRIQHKYDADDNTTEGTGETEDDEGQSASGSQDQEEEASEGGSDESSDPSSECDSQTE